MSGRNANIEYRSVDSCLRRNDGVSHPQAALEAATRRSPRQINGVHSTPYRTDELVWESY
ncbi:MAG: hypothetical protein ACYTEL_16335 [Planctomycetota bacterium]